MSCRTVALLVVSFVSRAFAVNFLQRNTTGQQIATFAEVHREEAGTALGPFDTEADACDYCEKSYTKIGDAPAGPIATKCVCMAHPDEENAGKFAMFCATPPSAAGYVAKKNGCTCKIRDLESMGKTTCKPIAP
eukprot:TRINITY_DN12700_c0_g1_i1.p3 TRINITY_DN12700_c0_g1~~TRINITY_DN12700_c0_g1_i1.p3  ORF type:complete len:150 (-),score=28.28 TRINITY_DN12700_c0_g1_i1:27-428(-)